MKKGYDRIEGEYYTRSRLFRWWHTHRFQKAYDIIDKIDENAIIVDLGCDGGNFTQKMLDLGEVIGLDISSSFIRAGKNRVKKGHFILSDVHSLPLRDGSFNLVTCLEVLEHLPTPERVIAESWRILRQGGKLFISTPDEGKRLWKIIWFFWQNIGRGTAWRRKHIFNFNRNKLVKLIHPFFTEITIDYVNFFMLLLLICRKRDKPNREIN